MKSTSTWITYLTAVIAIIALAISIATYLRSGPRVRVKVNLSSWWQEKDPTVTATVINSGLAPVDILSLAIGIRGIPGRMHLAELSGSNYRNDNSLLHRIEPGSQRSWHYALSELAEKIDRELNTASLGWLISKLPNGRPRLKLSLLIPLNVLMTGLIISVDLGNGVQKISSPSYILALKLFIHMGQSKPLLTQLPQLVASAKSGRSRYVPVYGQLITKA